MKYAISTRQFNLKVNFIRQQLLHTNEIIIFYTQFKRRLSKIVDLIPV